MFCLMLRVLMTVLLAIFAIITLSGRSSTGQLMSDISSTHTDSSEKKTSSEDLQIPGDSYRPVETILQRFLAKKFLFQHLWDLTRKLIIFHKPCMHPARCVYMYNSCKIMPRVFSCKIPQNAKKRSFSVRIYQSCKNSLQNCFHWAYSRRVIFQRCKFSQW